MAFSDFKSVTDVSQKYGTQISIENFVPEGLTMGLPSFFMEDLEYSLVMRKPNPSEIALSENFISPIIRYVAKKHPHIMPWSREYTLNVDAKLSGTPDYLFSYMELPKRIVFGMPLVCVAEAKVEKFAQAWGQTLAEMVACEKLYPGLTVFGWATNGFTWEFGKLQNGVFTQHPVPYAIGQMTEQIAGVLDWIFTEAVKNAEAYLAKKEMEKQKAEAEKEEEGKKAPGL